MAGQVSPEALLSRLQTEGGKTEAESEVRAYTLGICGLMLSHGRLFTWKQSFQPLKTDSGVERFHKCPSHRFHVKAFVKAIEVSECLSVCIFPYLQSDKIYMVNSA